MEKMWGLGVWPRGFSRYLKLLGTLKYGRL